MNTTAITVVAFLIVLIIFGGVVYAQYQYSKAKNGDDETSGLVGK